MGTAPARLLRGFVAPSAYFLPSDQATCHLLPTCTGCSWPSDEVWSVGGIIFFSSTLMPSFRGSPPSGPRAPLSHDPAGTRGAATSECTAISDQILPIQEFYLPHTYSSSSQSTSVTRWYINIPINEMMAIRESLKNSPHQIEWHGSDRPRNDPVEANIADIADADPSDVMGEQYKMKIEITEVVSTKEWWYMACKDCWKKVKLEGDAYKCPCCPVCTPQPRFKIVLNAIDAEPVDRAIAPMAEFTFFGLYGETIIGREAVMLVGNARGRTNYIPP